MAFWSSVALWVIGINTNPSCVCTRAPDTILVSSLGPDIVMTLVDIAGHWISTDTKAAWPSDPHMPSGVGLDPKHLHGLQFQQESRISAQTMAMAGPQLRSL